MNDLAWVLAPWVISGPLSQSRKLFNASLDKDSSIWGVEARQTQNPGSRIRDVCTEATPNPLFCKVHGAGL